MFTDVLHLSDYEFMLLAGAVVGLLASTLLGYRIGQRKDRPTLGFVLGGLLVLPGLVAIALVPRKEPDFY